MRYPLCLAVGWLALVFQGCATGFHPRRAETTTVAHLRTIWHSDTTDHLAYMGSDAQFHYIYHVRLGGGDTYRIPVSAWHPRRAFTLQHGKPELVRASDLSQ